MTNSNFCEDCGVSARSVAAKDCKADTCALKLLRFNSVEMVQTEEKFVPNVLSPEWQKYYRGEGPRPLPWPQVEMTTYDPAAAPSEDLGDVRDDHHRFYLQD